MLHHYQETIAAENRDFPEWHHERETYAVWVLRCDQNKIIQEKFKSAREHLNGYLLEPYHRQPHITLFVCGFLVDEPHYNDDFPLAHLDAQVKALELANIQPFEIEIGGFNSFASAPFLEVHDPEKGIHRLREILSRGGHEFRTASYTPHLTIGLYAGKFQSQDVMQRLAGYSSKPVRWKVESVALATYQAQEFTGKLKFNRHCALFTE